MTERDPLNAELDELRAEIERLTALAQIMGEERDRAWTEHLIEREELKAEIERLKAERRTTKQMLEDILEGRGVGSPTPHHGLGRGGLKPVK